MLKAEVEDRYDETISLHTAVYPLESVQLAALAFLDEGYFYISPADDSVGALGGLNVSVKARDRRVNDALVAKFVNELNRQSLRIIMSKMTRGVRTQIVGRALASATPVGAEDASEKEPPSA